MCTLQKVQSCRNLSPQAHRADAGSGCTQLNVVYIVSNTEARNKFLAALKTVARTGCAAIFAFLDPLLQPHLKIVGYEVFREGKITWLGSKLGVERIAAGSAKGSHSRSQQKTAIDVTRIGVIEMQDSMHTHSAT